MCRDFCGTTFTRTQALARTAGTKRTTALSSVTSIRGVLCVAARLDGVVGSMQIAAHCSALGTARCARLGAFYRALTDIARHSIDDATGTRVYARACACAVTFFCA